MKTHFDTQPLIWLFVWFDIPTVWGGGGASDPKLLPVVAESATVPVYAVPVGLPHVPRQPTVHQSQHIHQDQVLQGRPHHLVLQQHRAAAAAHHLVTLPAQASPHHIPVCSVVNQRIRIYFPDPELFVPDPARMNEQIK